MTVPIKALHAEIEALDLGNLDKTPEGTHGPALGEIDGLRLAFHDMRLKLNESIQEAVSLRAHEKEAQLVALQSQLNPHFLHNMLQTIAIMAEEGSAAAIQELIHNLTRRPSVRFIIGGNDGYAPNGDGVCGELPCRHAGQVWGESRVRDRHPHLLE